LLGLHALGILIGALIEFALFHWKTGARVLAVAIFAAGMTCGFYKFTRWLHPATDRWFAKLEGKNGNTATPVAESTTSSRTA